MRPAVAAVLLVLAGCGGTASGGSATQPSTAATEQGLSGTVTVFAAASLTDVFTGFGEQLEAGNDGLTVQFNFAGSSALATQITQGAPADVFASADPAQMATVTDAGLVGSGPELFAGNVLQIAVPAGDPGGVAGLADLADPDRTVALCAPEVPCGAAAQRLFDTAGLTPAPDTLEEDVKAALTKVQLGEVDASLVYATDVLAAGDDVEGIEVPEAADVVNEYPIATLAAAPNADGAAAFVDLVLSREGQQALADAGFRAP